MTQIGSSIQNEITQVTNKPKYDEQYLKDIEEHAFTRMDEAGNGDGKVTVDEALKDLDIEHLISDQNLIDTIKIAYAAKDIPEVLSEYAGADGVFSAEEWAEFINGDEWGGVLEQYHSSGKKAKIEMSWIDKARHEDGKATKGEMKAGLIQNLYDQGIDIDTTLLEAVVDKYAGKDGTFTQEEYQKLKKDPIYRAYTQKFNITPWYRREEE